MPLSSTCVELVSECLSHMKEAELLACMQVCSSWREEAKSFIFETLDLRKDQKKLVELQDYPHRIRYVRHIIGDPYYPFTHFRAAPTNVRTLEFYGTSTLGPPMSSEYTNQLIFTFRLNLEIFIFRDFVVLPYPSFCTILKSLGNCKRLRQLSLPPVHWSGSELRQNHADDADDAFRQLALELPNVEDRPQLQFLQLVPSSERESPQVSTTACSKGPRDSEYRWLEDHNCPFDLHALRVLVVGCPAAAQIILPIVSHSLLRLEFCQAFDPRSSWTQFGRLTSPYDVLNSRLTSTIEHFQTAPIQLSSLKHLVLTFLLCPSKWLLDTIRAPEIETITFKWATDMSHSSYEARFRLIDGQIARLDPTRVFPHRMAQIIFVTNCHLRPSTQWDLSVFPISSHFGVVVSHQPFTFYDE
ncbi:hypothetical protein F5876DRAFT_80661 [Lentinula aff. lateritia]|uniref:Uncharacterized protein n=1 Tax=Lentinula aff. lateritia TaxID=2804960 RepID=A0ACC1TNZ0_9AGAR|nr:hypothetical protein F5876DRAFT_80661 [Lentinula aff. lateritia]